MNPYLAEFIGTAVMILLGNGVVANVLLKDTKGANAGLVVITIAWGLAVFCGVIIAGPYSGAHLNPAVTLSVVLTGGMDIATGLWYAAAQFAGASTGAALVYVVYKNHYDITEDAGARMASFCTSPAIRNYGRNFLSEMLGTFVLIFVILFFGTPENTPAVGMGSLGALPVTLLIIAIGMSLGGTTGYAINPARDLAPRIMHTILFIKKKPDNDWRYSWVPVLGPLTGAALASALYLIIF
jgi:glycerol uptake facilitator protein